MYADITKPPAPLPTPQLTALSPGLSLLLPLTRRGTGPGLIVLTPDSEDQLSIKEGVPSPLIKWAEEGYTVVEIQAAAVIGKNPFEVLRQAVRALEKCEKCEFNEKVGLVAYGPELWNAVAASTANVSSIVAGIVYASTSDLNGLASPPTLPTLRHIAGGEAKPVYRDGSLYEYRYHKVASHKFAIPFQPEFHYSTEAVSHTRSLTFLKPRTSGPYFDLEAVWDEHTYYEFADRSVEHTMSTMVQEPYVNHVPTLTGGVGRGPLSKFYRDNFIFNNSADTELDLISRTIGIDRVIDEFIFNFTHDQEIDWMLPGVPPTGIKAAVPFTAVVNIRGDRLYHEHISWDQGTLLRQLGLMPEYLPYPHPLPDGRTAAVGKKFEYKVPVAGSETTAKMLDRDSVPSNTMFGFKIREV
ncbi:hypothetical protein F5Y15DRAFT_216535 [Xylariaceae sp. FL0016]|nr:hypothetical protein F5Y15DRAFT_216535 [Xylariaceae sp. FL0016]